MISEIVIIDLERRKTHFIKRL